MDFTNEAQLKKFLSKKSAKVVENAQKKIYEKFDDNINQFYIEFEPEEYIRTGALYNSLEATEVKRTGNQHVNRAEAEVRFNTPEYEQGAVLLKSGEYGWNTRTGEEVLDIALRGSRPHGDYAKGTAIWTQSMKSLGNKRGIEDLLKQEAKNQGL